MTVLLIALGAAVGAPLRYIIDRAVQSRNDSVFPWGTLCVNLLGCLLLSALAALPASPAMTTVAGIGFCGTLTTYSTFSYETLRLIQDRAWLLAGLNVTVSLIAGLGAAYCGLALAQAI